ncbi:hypothetical protein P3T18_003667 [Paraburkholderia sp. GAS199]|uniref:hypothetical protein n=1 Tax=Paraburkholderia sp. GAS199 TaxID=3035126 RepID=UPI003D25DEFE
MSKPKTPAHGAEKDEPSDDADSRLDEALMESFPASDPVAIDPDDDDPPRTESAKTSGVGKKRH